jgi:two-component system CheB/CheR fusion protein
LVREENTAVLRVSDTGLGIHPDMLPHLFEPFSQAENTLARSRGGLGLGLALVKGLVALHGGEVKAHSEGLGKGTEFVIRLPVEPAVADKPLAPQNALKPQRRRILIIEDNIDAASSLCDVLELGEHEVAVAHNGPDGLSRARAFQPEVILCDIGLPDMDGYAVARAIRADARLHGVCLVALSGYALPEDLQNAIDAGFDQHIAKPPSIEKLEALLAGLACGAGLQ